MPHNIRIYPHNDLLNIAYYHLNVIKDKVDHDEQNSLALDCLSCLIALAFAVESIINFVGFKVVEDWNERQTYIKKIKAVCANTGYEFDEDIDPFSTLKKLKELRDYVAHSKPVEKSITVATKKQLHDEMSNPWDGSCTPEFTNNVFLQVKEFKKHLLKHAGISIGRTLTGAGGWGL